MKALNVPFQMRYGSPVCYEKWLCGSPKCEAPLHEASPAKKYALKIATEMRFILCTWFGELSSCSFLTVLPGPAWVLLNKFRKE